MHRLLKRIKKDIYPLREVRLRRKKRPHSQHLIGHIIQGDDGALKVQYIKHLLHDTDLAVLGCCRFLAYNQAIFSVVSSDHLQCILRIIPVRAPQHLAIKCDHRLTGMRTSFIDPVQECFQQGFSNDSMQNPAMVCRLGFPLVKGRYCFNQSCFESPYVSMPRQPSAPAMMALMTRNITSTRSCF